MSHNTFSMVETISDSKGEKTRQSAIARVEEMGGNLRWVCLCDSTDRKHSEAKLEKESSRAGGDRDDEMFTIRICTCEHTSQKNNYQFNVLRFYTLRYRGTHSLTFSAVMGAIRWSAYCLFCDTQIECVRHRVCVYLRWGNREAFTHAWKSQLKLRKYADFGYIQICIQLRICWLCDAGDDVELKYCVRRVEMLWLMTCTRTGIISQYM